MKFLIALIFSIPSFSFAAGVLNGGGDKGIVCRDSDQKITSVETLDLYEARVQYGLELKVKSDSYIEIAKQVLSFR